MLCYRCGSHVPDTADTCGTCGQKLSGGGVRQATGTFSRKRLGLQAIDGAPYKPGDIVSDRYTIKDVTGAGPVGHVFRAHDKQIDVEVAIKVVNARLVQTSDERKQFSKAMRAGRKLSHPNLVRIYEDGEDKDRPYYTMQYLEGLTLRKIIDLRIAKGQFFTLREVEPILSQVAAAMDAMHKHGPHADLRPDNVLVLPDLLKVSDYGLGNAIPRLPFVQALKQRRGDAYLAPEYVQGIEIDQRVDLYSLGVIVGEMLCGAVPDGSIPDLTVINRELPAQLEGLYRKALNANPLARPKTAGEFFEEFAEITKRVSPPPLKAKPEPALPPRPRASGSSAPLQLVPRISEVKPPPPVPDELLSEVDQVISGVEEVPPDATQRLDGTGRDGHEPPPPPREVPDDATELMPSLPDAAPPPPRFRILEEPAEPTSSLQLQRRNRAAIYLIALTALGLLLGSGGGYLLLEHMRQPPPPLPERVEKPEEAPPPPPVTAAPPAPPPPVIVAPPPPPVKTAEPDRTAEKAAEERLAVQKALEEKAAAEQRHNDDEERRKAAEAAGKKDTKVATAAGEAGGCPAGMRFVGAGAFKIGTPKDDPMMGFDEKPLRSLDVAAYCIDMYEYPNRRGAAPVVNISWSVAKQTCESKGKRLCSEEEWEKACKGTGNSRFPYGNQFDANACNTQDETGEDRVLSVSGRFGRCHSTYGVADMSGNVAEWTSTPYASNADMTQKGGSFGRPDYAARCSARKNAPPGSRSQEVGFRCCGAPQ